ncbi:MAG: hypothetical protein U0W65_09515 [Bacteroidia bacterium]
MKHLIFIVLLVLTTAVFGQGTSIDTTKKEHNNIISIDATGLLRQFFNLNTNNYYPYTPYILTYRRVIKNNAIKLAVGADISINKGTSNDSLKSSGERNSYNVALGIEHYKYLNKRWNFYYGIDAVYQYSTNKSKYPRTTTTYYESSSESKSYGIAPTLGILFRITNRMSLSTETSYSISYVLTTSKQNEFPSSQYDRKSTSSNIMTAYFAPTALNFRFKF